MRIVILNRNETVQNNKQRVIIGQNKVHESIGTPCLQESFVCA